MTSRFIFLFEWVGSADRDYTQCVRGGHLLLCLYCVMDYGSNPLLLFFILAWFRLNLKSNKIPECVRPPCPLLWSPFQFRR